MQATDAVSTPGQVNLLSEGSYSKGSELTDGYPEFTYGVLKKLGWDKDLTADELATINKISSDEPYGVGWAVDLSGGIIRVTLEHGVMAYGNGKAPRGGVESARSRAGPSRADLHGAARSGRKIPDASGRASVPHGPTSASPFRRRRWTRGWPSNFRSS